MKSRYFMFILYAESQQNFIDFIIKNYSCIYILHDRDVNIETGEIKKAHYHIIIKFENQRNLKNVCEEIGIEPNYCQVILSYTKSLQYLIHMNNPEKFQYNIADCKGDLITDLENTFKDDCECEQVQYIINLLKSKKYVSYTAFISDICKCKLYSTFRRNGYWFKLLFDENNKF